MFKNKHRTLDNDPEFSIVFGGLLYQFYLQTGLVKPTINLWKRRMFAVSIITWLPLFILTAISGMVFGGVNIPFIFDFGTHTRFLGALPLLIVAELVAHQRIRDMVSQFVDRDIVVSADIAKLYSYLASAIKLRNSFVIEILLLIFVLTCGHWFWLEYTELKGSTWYATLTQGKTELNLTGYWYFFISLPIFQFVLLRWYFRILIWYKLLWQISRLPLKLNSLHPDRAGGLGFLTNSISAFGPLLLAHTVLLAGIIINRIWHEGATLLDFKLEVLGIIGLLIALVLIPLMFFLLPLALAKRIGTNRYGIMASNFVNFFRTKWLDNISASSIVNGDDIQSLADLSNSFETTRDMNILPFGLANVLQLFVISSLPLLPLIFTILPFEEIIRCVIRIVV